MGKRPLRHHYSEASLGYLAVALAATLWAISAALARALVDDGIHPLELAQARAVISVSGLALVPAAWQRTDNPRVATVIALGGAIALVNATYYVAIERLAVAVAIVLQYVGPALVVLWTALMLRRAPTRDVITAVAVTFVGVVLVSELPAGDFGSLDVVGIIIGLATAVWFASYTILSEKAGESYGVIGALFRGFIVASLLWIAFQSFRGWPSELFTADHLPSVLFIGIAGTLIPFLLYLWGVQKVRSERASIAATLEPVLVALIAWIWLGQSLSTMQIGGGILIIGAVLSLQLRGRAVRVPEP